MLNAITLKSHNRESNDELVEKYFRKVNLSEELQFS